LESENVTRNQKEQTLREIRNLPQLRRVYGVFFKKRPDSALKNNPESLITMILSKVKSKPRNSTLRWVGTKLENVQE
jgi:hypothetical protein